MNIFLSTENIQSRRNPQTSVDAHLADAVIVCDPGIMRLS